MKNPWMAYARHYKNVRLWEGFTKFHFKAVRLQDVIDECRSPDAYFERLRNALSEGVELPADKCSFALPIIMDDTEKATILYRVTDGVVSLHVLARGKVVQIQADITKVYDTKTDKDNLSFWLNAAMTWYIAKMMVRTTRTNTYIMEQKAHDIAPSIRAMYSYYTLQIKPRVERKQGIPPPGWQHFHHWHNRYHGVRGHYRTYANGKVAFVKPHHRGDRSLGIIEKDYEVHV